MNSVFKLIADLSSFFYSIIVRNFEKIHSAISIGAILGLILGLVIAHSNGGILGSRIGGDFVAFYAAGKIFSENQIENLYNLKTQAFLQNGLGTDLDGDSVQFFPYFPLVAFFFYPLSLLPIHLAYLIFALISIAMICATTLLFQKIFRLNWNFKFTLSIIFSFFPLLISLLGGQNTVFSLFIISLATYSYLSRRLVLSGIFWGILFYKPQIAYLFPFLFLQKKEWKVLFGITLSIGFFYLSNAAIMGSDWLFIWLQGINKFSLLESDYNKENFASFYGHFGAKYKELELLIILIICLIITRVASKNSLDILQRVCLAIISFPFTSYHFMYYDLGLFIFPIFACISKKQKNDLVPFYLLGILTTTTLIPKIISTVLFETLLVSKLKYKFSLNRT